MVNRTIWKRRAVGGWITADGQWTIRGPIMGKPMYWLYFKNGRYTPTGHYNEVVSFTTVSQAKAFVSDLVKSNLI
jgi:hypothetical protein